MRAVVISILLFACLTESRGQGIGGGVYLEDNALCIGSVVRNNQALDGLCEIANIIAGQAKAALSTTEYRFDRISVPSVIVGNNYSISHYRGMTSVSVEFELPEMPMKPGDYGTFSVNISMMKI